MQCAEKFGLHFERDFTDFVPKKCAAVSRIEVPRLILGREPLTAFLERHPSVAMKLLEKMASTSQWQTGMFLTLARRPLADRVVLRLLDLAESSGSSDADLATSPRISQSTLATMVGASRENVNRTLTGLVAAGIVRTDAGRYVIPAPDDVRRRIIAGWPALEIPADPDEVRPAPET